MPTTNNLKIWAQQLRAPFLILAVVLVLIGTGAAYSDGYSHWGHFVLLMIGVILAHASVNLFNELSDYHTRIDENTTKTPFSGGSGMMQAGLTTPTTVRLAAYGTLALTGLIGIYFCLVVSWNLLVFMVLGGMAIRFYTTHLAKLLLGELFSGLTLGTFVVLGVYYVLTGHLTSTIILISIPPGILTSLLLFLNEFPDAEADKQGGRNHLIIHFGKRKCTRIYIISLAVVYTIILLAPFLTKAPLSVLLGLLTLPLAVKASMITLKHHDNLPKLVPALGMNVGVVILTDLLLAVGYFI